MTDDDSDDFPDADRDLYLRALRGEALDSDALSARTGALHRAAFSDDETAADGEVSLDADQLVNRIRAEASESSGSDVVSLDSKRAAAPVPSTSSSWFARAAAVAAVSVGLITAVWMNFDGQQPGTTGVVPFAARDAGKATGTARDVERAGIAVRLAAYGDANGDADALLVSAEILADYLPAGGEQPSFLDRVLERAVSAAADRVDVSGAVASILSRESRGAADGPQVIDLEIEPEGTATVSLAFDADVPARIQLLAFDLSDYEVQVVGPAGRLFCESAQSCAFIPAEEGEHEIRITSRAGRSSTISVLTN